MLSASWIRAFPMSARVYFKALGCRLNEAELERWARECSARGCTLAAAPEDADLVVVNTCAVTAEAVRKSRRLLRQCRRRNPNARLVVSGCYASLDPEAVRAMDGVDLLVGNADKDGLVALAVAGLAARAPAAQRAEPAAAALLARGRSRAFVKIQDGCRHRCTFCIVTVARGSERSRPIAEVVAEVRALADAGVPEAVLTGVHVGGYGADLGTDLGALIRAILADTDLPRLRLASVEPWDLPEAFFALFDHPRLMPHVHLPLQSGCDATLKRMGRRCRSADYGRLVDRARAAVADFNVTTDIIVGFPGETEADWRGSLGCIERIGFGHVHVFPFSPRPGTAAAAFPGQVPETVRRARCAELHELAAQMKQRWLARFVGRELPVLWESPVPQAGSGRAHCAGYTPNYLRCTTAGPSGTLPANTIASARLGAVAADGESLHAVPVG